MDKFLLLLGSLVLSVSSLSAQRNLQSKNELGVIYGISLTKTSFDKGIEEYYLGDPFIREVYRSKKPDAPLLGYDLGLYYRRVVGKKVKIYFDFRHTVKGQKSPHFYNYYGRDPNGLSPGYGGLSYTIRMVSNEFTLGVLKKYYTKGKIEFSFGAGFVFNVFNKLQIKDFLIEKDTGIERVGCCTISIFSPASNKYFDRFKTNLELGHIRLGPRITHEIQYLFSNDFSCFMGLEASWLSNVVGNSKYIGFGVMQGQVFTLSLTFGIQWRF